MDQSEREPNTHAPGHSAWPIGVAIGVAAALAGLVVSWWIVAVGAIIALASGAAWAYDVSRERRVEPPAPPRPPEAGEPVRRAPIGEQQATRAGFLGAMTVGLGAAIGGLVTVPPLVLAGVPPFRKGEGFADISVDLGPIGNYLQDQWYITSFNIEPPQGDVADRTAYVRYNGMVENDKGDPEPSFTILSNRCVHLGCPVQPNGPVEQHAGKLTLGAGQRKVKLTPVLPAGFGCPCHGGQYDIEGNRTAGPPVRALDRYAYEIRDGRLILVGAYSVDAVDGTGAEATMGRYRLAAPGIHIDGVSQILYPFIPPS